MPMDNAYHQGARNWWNMFRVAHYPHFGRLNEVAIAWVDTFYAFEYYYARNLLPSGNPLET